MQKCCVGCRAPHSRTPPPVRPQTGAIAGHTTLSLSLRTDCRLPPGYTFRWQYVGPDAHAYPLAPAARRFEANITFPAPWPPPAFTTAALVFGVCVQDAAGSAVGAMLGNTTATVHAPACPPAPACGSAALWADPPLHLRCWRCGAPAGPYLRGHALPHLRACAEVTPGQVLALLQTLRRGFALRMFEQESAGLGVRPLNARWDLGLPSLSAPPPARLKCHANFGGALTQKK